MNYIALNRAAYDHRLRGITRQQLERCAASSSLLKPLIGSVGYRTNSEDSEESRAVMAYREATREVNDELSCRDSRCMFGTEVTPLSTKRIRAVNELGWNKLLKYVN